MPTVTSEDDEAWKVLADCQVSLPLVGLSLKLVPRLMEKVASIITKQELEDVSVNFTNPVNGPTIMDEQSLIIKVIIHGQEVSGSIVDGGSGVNVINKTTSNRLGITTWNACPFWLRMTDISTVRPLGLIGQLDIIISGHAFRISVVLLHLDAPGANPLLLGRP